MVTFCSGTDVVIFFTPFTNLMFCFIFVSHPEQCITGFVVTTRVSLACLLFPPAFLSLPLYPDIWLVILTFIHGQYL